MLDESLTDHRAAAGQHLEETLGQTGLECELAEADAGEGGPFGRLQHDGVARCEGGGEAPRGDRHGEVPRRDHADDAQGLVEGDVHAAGDRNLLADQSLGRCRVVFEHVAHVAGLPARLRDRVARVRGFELRELLDVGVDGRGEAAQHACAVGGGHRGPLALGVDGRDDCRVGAGRIEVFDLGDDALVGGVDDGVAHACSFACL